MLTICNESGCNGGAVKGTILFSEKGAWVDGVYCKKCGRVHKRKPTGILIPVFTQTGGKIFYSPILGSIVLLKPRMAEEEKRKN
ncbi:MAG TPA: hypothetical protein P5232_02475 [Candidatus Moranbacteria bacterium]|nr:hypothetical protein [Candidatus Moranbacteria bacterium]